MASGFTCPACGRMQRFTEAVATQRVRCTGCGRSLIAPMDAGEPAVLDPQPSAADDMPKNVSFVLAPADTDDADLEIDLANSATPGRAAPKPPPSQLTRCPSCGSAINEGAVVCLNCGYHLEQGAAIRTRMETQTKAGDGNKPPVPALADARPWESPLRHVYSPVALTVMGVLLIWLDTLIMFDPTPFGGNAASLRLQYVMGRFFTVMVQLPFLGVGLMVLWLFGTRFRHLSLAVLKMIALVVTAAAVTGCAASISQRLGLHAHVWHLPFTWAIGLATFWAVATWLFELRVIETLLLYLVTVLAPVQTAGLILAEIAKRM